MRVLGFNFTKLSVEKKDDAKSLKDLKINTNVEISEIKEAKTDVLKTDEEFVAVSFVFEVEYSPNIAKIEIKGSTLFSMSPKKVKEVLTQWEDKKMPEDFKTALFNLILRKASIRALEFEEEMSLPAHLPLPRVGGSRTEEKKDK
ncbi:MAG: hypothetical protein AABX88_01330 [Nanoarchaeota archaeon]